MLQIVGNKLRRIKNNLFPIKAKTLMHLDFKRNAKRKTHFYCIESLHLGLLEVCVLFWILHVCKERHTGVSSKESN